MSLPMSYEKRPTSRLIRVASLATLIPFMMAVGPLMGWFIGQWIGRRLSYESTGALIGLAFGLAAGAREAYGMTRRIIDEMKEHNGK
jgi:hypothetical protein